MRHVYRCPVRWADLDMLGHVNNVVYVDYLQEARVDMLRTHAPDPRAEGLVGRVDEGLVVVRHSVDFRAPLEFRHEPVSIECWVTDVRAATLTMAYEIFDEVDGERTVYTRASTVLAPYRFAEERPRRLTGQEKDALARFHEPGPLAPVEWSVPRRDPDERYPLHVRFSDVDVYGHVNNVKYFEYYQEARIRQMDRWGRDRTAPEGLVVAHVDVEYAGPIHFRPEPYDMWTWVARVGNRSFTLDAEIRDGDRTLSRSRAVLLFFDPATQRSVPPPPEVRERLLALTAEAQAPPSS